MDVRKRNNVISSIELNIKCVDMRKSENKERFVYLMQYFTRGFVNEMKLFKAKELLEFANTHGIKISERKEIIIEHEKGSSLCWVSNYSNRTEVKPLIAVDSPNFLSQWTFTIGHFSDVSVHLDTINEKVLITTIDTLPEHDIYLLWVLENVEKYFYTTEMFDDFSVKDGMNSNEFYPNGYYAYNDYPNYAFLIDIINERINKNKSIRIDTLRNADGLTLKEYFAKNQIFKYCNTETMLFKMCLEYGKPYKQIRAYVEKYAY